MNINRLLPLAGSVAFPLRHHRSITPVLVSCISSLFASQAVAVDRIKASNTNPLNVGASWVGNAVPGVNDIAVWNSTVTAPNSSAIGGDLSWMGIRIVDVGGARNTTNNVVIANAGSANTLTIGAGGIDMSSAFQISAHSIKGHPRCEPDVECVECQHRRRTSGHQRE
jgi:hypothetical protein